MWPGWEDRESQWDPAVHAEHCQSPPSVSSLNGREEYNKLLITSFFFFSPKTNKRATGIFQFSSSHFFFPFKIYLANIEELHIWMQLTWNNYFDSLIFERNSKFSLSLKALLLLVCLFPRLSDHFPWLFWQQYTYPCNQKSMGNWKHPTVYKHLKLRYPNTKQVPLRNKHLQML